MEEAESLADWIAIMSHGKLSCYGSPLFLKNIFNSGYLLTFVREKDENRLEYEAKTQNIVSILKKYVPYVM